MAQNSLITADTNLRRLGSFCNWASVKPWKLIDKSEKDITDLISDYISYAESKKWPDSISCQQSRSSSHGLAITKSS